MRIYINESKCLLMTAASVQRFLLLCSALAFCLVIVPQICRAQAIPADPFMPGERVSPAPAPTPVKTITVADQSQPPFTDRERAMLKLIQDLQERVTKLESAQEMRSNASAEKQEQTPKVSPSVSAAAANKQNDDRVS